MRGFTLRTCRIRPSAEIPLRLNLISQRQGTCTMSHTVMPEWHDPHHPCRCRLRVRRMSRLTNGRQSRKIGREQIQQSRPGDNFVSLCYLQFAVFNIYLCILNCSAMTQVLDENPSDFPFGSWSIERSLLFRGYAVTQRVSYFVGSTCHKRTGLDRQNGRPSCI